MRVTFLHYIYGSTGPLVQLNEFARAFRELGHQLSVHAVEGDPAPRPWAEKVEGNFRRFATRYFHEWNTLRKNLTNYPRECRIVETERPDLVLNRYKLYHCSAAFAARRFQIPLIAWLDAPASYEQRRYLKEFVQIPGIAERVERFLIKAADRALVMSEEAKRYLPEGASLNGHVETIANGVDPEKFHPGLNGGGLRSSFPVGDPVILGFAGSFSPWHGSEGLKAMLAFTLKSYPHACFLLVGDGPQRRDISAFVRSMGYDESRVRFTGHVDHHEVPDYLAAMDICLLPYDQKSEGFYFSPLKLFEYMACGKPVLAAALGQISRMVRDGSNGLLYSTSDPREVAQKLKRLIEDAGLRKRLGERARETVLQNHTWHHTARRMEQIFENVLEQKRALAAV